MYEKYIEYIKRTGGSPKIKWFDDDFEPIGKTIRKEMKKAGLIVEKDGKIKLT